MPKSYSFMRVLVNSEFSLKLKREWRGKADKNFTKTTAGKPEFV
jgi:hypothetical protein